MNRILITYLTVLIYSISHSQNQDKIINLEIKKTHFNIEIENLKDSIKTIDLKIAKLNSETFLEKIKDSSIKAIARRGTKLRKDSNFYADIITVFKKDNEVIILDYKDGYFEICQNSICGYINEVWLDMNNLTSNFVKSKKAEQKLISTNNIKHINYHSSSLNNTKSKYKTTKYNNAKTYIRGSRGGCYYINSNGNKTYVSRSLCN